MPKPESLSVRDFLRLAHERFRLAADAEAETRRLSLDDLKFSIGEQWPQDIIAQRNLDGRPCLTMDRIKGFVRLVVNEQRQQRPATQVDPIGDGADVDTAEIYQGTIRHIEVNSDSEVVDDYAFDHMVRAGFGHSRLLTQYVDDESDDQEIVIAGIPNQFTVYWDPNSTKPDRSDAEYAFIVEEMGREKYRREYPESALSGVDDLTSVGDSPEGWLGDDAIRVAEYFYVEHDEIDGKQGRSKRRVEWSKINGKEILEESKWLGKYIPINTVLGDELIIDGHKYVAGLVRSAKDPQRQYNYMQSAATEAIALAPKAPWTMVEGQDEGHETEWAQSNVRNFSRLVYKSIDVNGKPAPPPQRNVVEPPIQAISIMTRQADQDLKATTGIFDPTLGEHKSDQSGTAINALQKQSSVATLNYSDNMARYIRCRGRMLVDLIPKIYTNARVQRIINPDGSSKHVIIQNGPDQQGAAEALLSDKVQKIYDIGVGRYDVTVSVGPSYQSKRQEAVATQLEFLKLLPPELAANFVDLVTANMDWPQAKEFAARAKKLLPPQLQDENDQDPQQKLQATQSKLQALMQQHELLVKALNDAMAQIHTKQQELDSKERIVALQEQTKIVVAEIGAKLKEAQFQADKELAQLQMMHDGAHDAATQAVDHSHEQQMAQQASQQQQMAQQTDHTHEQDMAAQQQAAQPAE